MAISFPSSIRSPSYNVGVEWDRPIIESPFEDGSVQTRLQYQRGRDTYTIPWDCLTQKELDLLERFYKVTTAYGSLPFTITIPLATGKRSVTCRIIEKPSVAYNQYNLWSASIKVREV